MPPLVTAAPHLVYGMPPFPLSIGYTGWTLKLEG